MENKNKKLKLVSGIQPSNRLTLGNYLGAIKNFLLFQEQYDSYIFVADYHAITSEFNPEELKDNRFKIVKTYIAAGLDPNKTKIFFQSAVKEHLELCYLLLTHTTIGELNRMTQFKDKSSKFKQKNQTITIPTGLLIYPVLMAADILMYDVDLVPVGKDQKQHLELARDIAERFNKKYKQQVFQVPKEFIAPIAARVLDLKDPSKKMSKSNKDTDGTIFLDDNLETVKTKFMKAKTDSLNQINYDPINQAGVSNLLEIYASIKNLTIEQTLKHFENKTYKDLKIEVGEVVCETLKQIQKNLSQLDDQTILNSLKKSTELCQKLAKSKVNQIQKLFSLDYEKNL